MAQNRVRTSASRVRTSTATKSPAKRSWPALVGHYVLKAALYFFGVTIVWVTVLKFLPVWVTPLMVARKTEAIFEDKNSKIYSNWTPIDAMSKDAPLAVVASEDQLFPAHWGFDFKAMNNAFRYNLRGKKIRGASTISQQVAKNVFLWQDRSYLRKVLEVYFTFLIEFIWGKERILEVYLNVAETGDMTFGVEAASQRFFGKSAAQISRVEAARIAAVLPNPRRFSAKNPSGYVERRTSQIARQMRMLGRGYVAQL